MVVVFVGLEEDLLRNILGLRGIAGDPRGGRENHVLVIAHEGGEIGRRAYAGFGGVHWRGSIVRLHNPGPRRKVAGIFRHFEPTARQRRGSGRAPTVREGRRQWHRPEKPGDCLQQLKNRGHRASWNCRTEPNNARSGAGGNVSIPVESPARGIGEKVQI